MGLGIDCKKQASPQLIKSLLGIPFMQVAAGGAHSFVLTLSGAIFGWGRNKFGQLGLNDENGRFSLFINKCTLIKRWSFEMDSYVRKKCTQIFLIWRRAWEVYLKISLDNIFKGLWEGQKIPFYRKINSRKYIWIKIFVFRCSLKESCEKQYFKLEIGYCPSLVERSCKVILKSNMEC